MEKPRSHLTKLYNRQMNFHKPSIVSLLSVNCFSRARLVPYCHCTVRGRRANIRHRWVEYLFHGPQQAIFGTTMVEHNVHHCQGNQLFAKIDVKISHLFGRNFAFIAFTKNAHFWIIMPNIPGKIIKISTIYRF